MLYLYTVEYTIISFLYLLNILRITNFLFGTRHGIKPKLIVIVYFCVSAVIVPVKEYCPPLLRLLTIMLYYTVMVGSVHIISRRMIKQSAYITIMYQMIDSMIQTVSFIIARGIFNCTDKSQVVWITSLIFNTLVFILGSCFLRKEKIFINPGIHLISDKIYFLTLVAFIFAGALLENQVSETSNIFLQNLLTKVFTIITIIILGSVIIALLYSCIVKNYLKNVSEALESQIEKQIKYYERLNALNNEIREFRHDYKNHMICLQGLLANKDYCEAENYVKNITKLNIIESDNILSGNRAADAILNDRLRTSGDMNIAIRFSGKIFDGIPPSDMCTILSNALDNAFEACMKINTSDIKIINIECAYIQNVQIIRITNPIGEEVEIDNNASIKTSKQNSQYHGFGLYNIKKTVNKYKGNFNISIENNNFIFEVIFKTDEI